MQIDLNDTPQPQPQTPTPGGRPAIAVPVPFLTRQVGLGETISGILSGLFGVQPCGGCKARAEALDQEVRFVPWG